MRKTQPLESDLRDAVEAATPRLRAISEERASARPSPGKWCAKEVLAAFRAVPAEQSTTLEYFMADYVEHLRHHLAQILRVPGRREVKK